MALLTLDELEANRRRLQEERQRLREQAQGPHVALPCPCGESVCMNWHVAPHADLQGVTFTKQEAVAVAAFLNEREATA